MPTLEEHSSSEFVKLIYIGASGTGKTGSLVSLMPEYDLRFIDMDNGLNALINFAKVECPDRLSSVQYNTFRDHYVSTPLGVKVKGSPKALIKASAALDKWPDDGSNPAEWGPKKILVLDSLTWLGKAAFEWAKGQQPTVKDPRLWYTPAQDLLLNILAEITGDDFKTNVIVCTHIDWREDELGIRKGYPNSIGQALNDKIPSLFNTTILAQTKADGKRTIHTTTSGQIDLKNPAPMRIDKTYPLETGMASIFKTLKGD